MGSQAPLGEPSSAALAAGTASARASATSMATPARARPLFPLPVILAFTTTHAPAANLRPRALALWDRECHTVSVLALSMGECQAPLT